MNKIGFLSILSLLLLTFSAPAHATSVGAAIFGPPKKGETVPAAAEVPKDELGRDNPRGTLSGFISALGQDDYQKAASFLNLSYLPKTQAISQSEILAKHLQTLMDSSSITPASMISNDPMGKTDDGLSEGLERLGTLKGKTNYKVLGPLLRDFFAQNVEGDVLKVLDDFFNNQLFNNLDDEKIRAVTDAISSLPINRRTETIDNEYILIQRKTHPRSYEHWYEPEVSLFEEIIAGTNNLDLIATIFQRSPDSLRAYYKKIFRNRVLMGF